MRGIDLNKLSNDSKVNQNFIEKTFEENKISKEIGFLGNFFGSGESVKMNIAGLTIVILILFGIAYTLLVYYFNKKSDFQIWNVLTPIITLSLGYIFGKNSN